jgi:integrase
MKPTIPTCLTFIVVTVENANPVIRKGLGPMNIKSERTCGCLIFVSGTLGGKFDRQPTGHWAWEKARVVAAAREAAGSWYGTAITPQPVPLEPSDLTRERATVADATGRFLEVRFPANTNASDAIQYKYRLLMRLINEFSQAQGIVMIDQWGLRQVEDFILTWKLGDLTRRHTRSRLSAFFRYCAKHWIRRSPVDPPERSRYRNDAAKRNDPKIPFSDEELERMHIACAEHYGSRRHKWTGQDLWDFICLSYHTGLRISDIALFRANKLTPSGHAMLYARKNLGEVYVWIPVWLQERIRERERLYGHYIFGRTNSKDLNHITEGWLNKLNDVWRHCGPFEEKPTPHRFRHTFARILLENPEIPTRTIADLLGITEEILKKHYSKWMKGRHDSATQILKVAWGSRPILGPVANSGIKRGATPATKDLTGAHCGRQE